MADSSFVRSASAVQVTAGAAVAAGEVWQLPGGQAAAYDSDAGASSGDRTTWATSGQYTLTKAAGVVLLDGGRAYWDHSANAVTFRKVNDRDFYLGRIVGDAASADTTCVVNLNVDPPYDLDLARDPFYSVVVGTQAAGGLAAPHRRGGAHKLLITATSEAQKTDALGKDGFAVGANAIVEMAVEVVSSGASAADVNVGVASATHATDADSIAQHLFLHLDGGSTNISFQSKDGTTTVAAVDSTLDYTAGTRFEVWFDLRNEADVQVYVDGVNVLPATVFNVAAAAGPLKLLAHAEKTSSTDTVEVDVDWLRARFSQQ